MSNLCCHFPQAIPGCFYLPVVLIILPVESGGCLQHVHSCLEHLHIEGTNMEHNFLALGFSILPLLFYTATASEAIKMFK